MKKLKNNSKPKKKVNTFQKNLKLLKNKIKKFFLPQLIISSKTLPLPLVNPT
jgi:hypothetical protein